MEVVQGLRALAQLQLVYLLGTVIDTCIFVLHLINLIYSAILVKSRLDASDDFVNFCKLHSVPWNHFFLPFDFFHNLGKRILIIFLLYILTLIEIRKLIFLLTIGFCKCLSCLCRTHLLSRLKKIIIRQIMSHSRLR